MNNFKIAVFCSILGFSAIGLLTYLPSFSKIQFVILAFIAFMGLPSSLYFYFKGKKHSNSNLKN